MRPAIGGIRIYASRDEREAREHHADVDRAIVVLGGLGGGGGHLGGRPRDLRRRWDALLDELHPRPIPWSRWERALRRVNRWLGSGAHARAGDVGLASLFGALPFGVEWVGLEWAEGQAVDERGIRVICPAEGLRSRVAAALDDAYAVLLPHEAARRAELRRRFFGAGRWP